MNFTEKILSWYDENKRVLPWRENIDPYRIWLSEVIMQQTQIVQGTSYYLRFLERFPNIYHLAEADEHDVLMLWQGLGYYSRARNLHHSAKTIVEKHKGRFPERYEELLKLKGIGDYTASMILSVCFNQDRAAVDGNVMRLVARLFGVGEAVNKPIGFRRVKDIVNRSISKDRPGDFNQGMMEFGAMHCIPRNPECSRCIFQNDCYAYQKGMVRDLPIKEKSKPKGKEYLYYLDCRDTRGSLYIKKREKGIWKGLYEFPLLTSQTKLSIETILGRLLPDGLNHITSPPIISKEIKHLLTHKALCIQFIRVEIPEEVAEVLTDYIVIQQNRIFDYPFPVVINEYMKNAK